MASRAKKKKARKTALAEQKKNLLKSLLYEKADK